ncbi:regulatory protein GemA [Ancylobacter lacus]|uniref:regulatory protein GemA n=1 Tax=Ancylobacter lacus TaxID=2579970 RepID=UPI001BD1B66F|nr:regulatory protein GemA [Ancylobacter lacus]MBS7539744.1 regulatory protein GemA [Ancylobacter lacus]
MIHIPASRQQIGAIHAEKARIGLDDETYRDVMQRETGCRSSTDLTASAAGRLLDHMRAQPGRAPGVQRRSGAVERPVKPASRGGRLDGTYGHKLQALWISGYNLGVVQDRSDKALLAFVEKQTGVSHTRFLQDHRAAAKAVEAIKDWLTREAGVAWGASNQSRAQKVAVYYTQRRRLDALGVAYDDLPLPNDASSEELTQLMRLMGDRLRKAMGLSPAPAKRGKAVAS